jgi:hypothetical protein
MQSDPGTTCDYLVAHFREVPIQQTIKGERSEISERFHRMNVTLLRHTDVVPSHSRLNLRASR